MQHTCFSRFQHFCFIYSSRYIQPCLCLESYLYLLNTQQIEAELLSIPVGWRYIRAHLLPPWCSHQSSPRTLVAFGLWFWQPSAPFNLHIWYSRIWLTHTQSLLSILAAHLVDRHLGNFIWRYFGNQISTYNWLGFRKWERISLLCWNFNSGLFSWKWKTHLPAFFICQIYRWFFLDLSVIFLGFLCDFYWISLWFV